VTVELIRSVKKVEKCVLSRRLNVLTLSAALMDSGIDLMYSAVLRVAYLLCRN